MNDQSTNLLIGCAVLTTVAVSITFGLALGIGLMCCGWQTAVGAALTSASLVAAVSLGAFLWYRATKAKEGLRSP